MFAVIVYFLPQWRITYFQDVPAFKKFAVRVIVATALTAVVGEIIIKIIEKTLFRDVPHAQIEDLFSHLEFIAPALAGAGLLILIAGLSERRHSGQAPAGTNGAAAAVARTATETHDLGMAQAAVIGAVQGLCLPFRGFSRSGATISTAMLLGVMKSRAEAFSFALAVVLTPPVVVRESLRLIQASRADPTTHLGSIAISSMFGAVVAFFAGLVALKWLSRWLEAGRWYLFGIYCLIAAAGVMALHRVGY
jgi:undecaprenyl-diphosphatase